MQKVTCLDCNSSYLLALPFPQLRKSSASELTCDARGTSIEKRQQRAANTVLTPAEPDVCYLEAQRAELVRNHNTISVSPDLASVHSHVRTAWFESAPPATRVYQTSWHVPARSQNAPQRRPSYQEHYQARHYALSLNASILQP